MVQQMIEPGAGSVARKAGGRALLARLLSQRWLTGQGLVCTLTVVVVAYLALVPLGTLVYASFQTNLIGTGPSSWTFSNFTQTFEAPDFGRLLITSIEFSAYVTIAATIIGFALGWIYVRTNTPGRRFTLLMAVGPLVVPGLLTTTVWILLLTENGGPINVVLTHLHLPQVQIYSMLGMVIVQTTHMVPLSFLMGVGILSSMDRSLEESAATCGANPRRVLTAIVTPLVRPAMLGSALLTFVLTMSSFEVPQLIGTPAHIYTLTTQIFNDTTQFPIEYGTTAVLGVIVLVVTLTGLYSSRKLGGSKNTATVTGKGFKPNVIELGRARWLTFAVVAIWGFLALILPFIGVVWASLLPVYENPSASAFHKLGLGNFRSIFTSHQIIQAVENTLIVALGTALAATILALIIGYILVKTKTRGRRPLELLATTPIAMPEVILGIALLYWYLAAPLPVHLYGTLAILIIAFATSAIPFGLRFIEPALAQISAELEEAATNSGATWGQTVVRVYIPLMRQALMGSFLYCFVIGFRQLTSALFLYTQQSIVISVSMYTMWVGGSYTQLCALGLVMLVLLVIIVLLAQKLGGRGIGASLGNVGGLQS